MIKIFKHKTLTSVFAFVMGVIILMSPLTAYAGDFIYSRTIGADGVRLRKTPSFTGIILELMYRKEEVLLNSENSDIYWIHVKRVKTGTTGYMGYDLYDHE